MHPDALLEEAISGKLETDAGYFAGSGITATATDYRAGRLYAVSIPLLGDSLETAIQQSGADLER